MLCENCNKNTATVHMKQIINGKMTETHLCEECAGVDSNGLESPISLDNFFQSFLGSFFNEQLGNASEVIEDFTREKECPKCHMTFRDIKNMGRLGCSDCYDTFRNQLDNIFKGIQAGNRHSGKIPKKSESKLSIIRKIEQMKEALKNAVALEEYEKAAQIRDGIKEMEGGI